MDTAPVTPPPAPPPPQLQPALVRARLARPSSEAATEARKRRPGSRTTRASRDTVHTDPGLLGAAEVDLVNSVNSEILSQTNLGSITSRLMAIRAAATQDTTTQALQDTSIWWQA